MSGGRRIEIDVRAVPDFGRPRGFSSRLAAGAPNNSGRTSLAGFAFANVALFHSGFSAIFRALTVLRFIESDLTSICLAETDHVNAPCTRSEHQCVQSARDHAQCLQSSLAVVPTDVFDHKRTVPFKLLDQLERQAALGYVPLVLSRVETNGHVLLYIRIYAKATTTPDAACGNRLKVAGCRLSGQGRKAAVHESSQLYDWDATSPARCDRQRACCCLSITMGATDFPLGP